MSKRIGIVVSGGPAPGINSVISSSVIAGEHRGYEVYGIQDGFLGAINGSNIRRLQIEEVSRIYKSGGSILGTSRINPLESNIEKFKRNLSDHKIDKLIVIGGEGSAWVSYQITKHLPSISVVHVPKTIDNDLMLPNQYPSFGFETARSVGTKILDTLSVDARTTKRWFVVTSMGRHAGFLALGLGVASRATSTFIPEEFEGRKPSVQEVASLLMGSVRARHSMGKPFGLIVVAEGIIDVLDPNSVPEVADCPRDHLGRIRHSEVHISDLLVKHMRSVCKSSNLDMAFYTKNLGYELRCADPVSFDIEYTTFLGLGAVRLLDEGATGVMVTREFDRIGSVALQSMMGPDGRMMSRKLDLNSDLYKVARSFMIR